MTSLGIVLVLALIGILVGVLIGSIGIGGVLLVPALIYVGEMDTHVAITSCLFAYLFSGAVGTFAFARRGSIRWSASGWLCGGAMPGAFAGAATIPHVPGSVLELLIAALIVFAGAHALMNHGLRAHDSRSLGPVELVLIGAVTGFGSAMSGTGGPLILVPVLVWLNLPVLAAVGLSQVIQVPVAALATAGNLVYGEVNMAVGLATAVLLIAGVSVGARIAHRVSAAALKRVVAIALIVVGILIFGRFAVGAFGGATA